MTVKAVAPWLNEPRVIHEHRDYTPTGPWADDAACKPQPAAMEMPEGKRTGDGNRRVAVARLICDACPVQAECLEWAMTTPDPAYGLMAGGLTPGERDQRRRNLR